MCYDQAHKSYKEESVYIFITLSEICAKFINCTRSAVVFGHNIAYLTVFTNIFLNSFSDMLHYYNIKLLFTEAYNV